MSPTITGGTFTLSIYGGTTQAIAADATPEQIQAAVDAVQLWQKLIQHATGATGQNRRSNHGFRNFFCAGRDSEDFKTMQEMEAAGYMTAGRTINDNRDQYFHATEAGCKFAGLHPAAIKRAMTP